MTWFGAISIVFIAAVLFFVWLSEREVKRLGKERLKEKLVCKECCGIREEDDGRGENS